MEMSAPDLLVQKDDIISSVYKDGRHLETDSTQSHANFDVETTVRDKSPITVQAWVDALPLIPECGSREECDTIATTNPSSSNDIETDMFTLGAEAGHMCARETSIASPVNVTITGCHESSEVDSHCSSVDSLLEARKPDPEEILLSLGFGGTASSSYLETGRVPKRFLSPSQLKGVDIEEFIREQRDLIYTFESGFYGYRGLAGPSHSSPSVIVAKILEKLREHEKEAASMNLYPLDFRKRCSVDQDATGKQSKKFSKVAHNVLTKIRCTPGSVLSPDNRRWLDNQGNKSPEIARRLILGQQSFTFGHDGDLIESFDVSESDRDESSNINFKYNRRNVKNNGTSSDLEKLSPNKKWNIEDPGSDDSPIESSADADSSPSESIILLPTALLENASNGANRKTSLEKSTSSFESNEKEFGLVTNKTLSLRDEIVESSRENDKIDSMNRNESASTRCSNSFGKCGRISDQEPANRSSFDEHRYSENANEFSDSATESEFAAYASRTFLNTHLGRLSNSVTREQFLSLSTEQRTSLQSRVIREALKMYLNQLKEDDINIELKTCLSNEVRKVFDLVDGSSDSSKLAIIVRQMTLLLQQQYRLSAQIKELSIVDAKPSSCNKICDHLLKRVQDLESLVQQNAQELAQMKNQLLSQK